MVACMGMAMLLEGLCNLVRCHVNVVTCTAFPLQSADTSSYGSVDCSYCLSMSPTLSRVPRSSAGYKCYLFNHLHVCATLHIYCHPIVTHTVSCLEPCFRFDDLAFTQLDGITQ